jgi:hypothetical protein
MSCLFVDKFRVNFLSLDTRRLDPIFEIGHIDVYSTLIFCDYAVDVKGLRIN